MAELIPFLKKIKTNNNREWFEKNRPSYEASKAELLALMESVIKKFSTVDPSIASIEPKKTIFRINRDVRFSKNKDPYKTNMGAYLVDGGKKSPKAGYYLHIEPGNSFLAGGLWQPEPDLLKKIRQEIDYNGVDLEKIMKEKKFSGIFGGMGEGNALVNVPKGFDPAHPYADWLKQRSFIIAHAFPDKLLNDPLLADYCVLVFKEMVPFNQFLNRVFED